MSPSHKPATRRGPKKHHKMNDETNNHKKENILDSYVMKSTQKVPPLPIIRDLGLKQGRTEISLLKFGWMTILSILLLIGAYADMGYRYYDFIRVAVCISFVVWAYYEITTGINFLAAITAFGIAILFNPAYKLTFEKDTWFVFDWISVCWMGLTIWFNIWLMKRTKKTVVRQTEEYRKWLRDVFADIEKGEWGYHLAMAALEKEDMENWQKAKISGVLNHAYGKLSDENKKSDHLKYVMLKLSKLDYIPSPQELNKIFGQK